MPSETVSTPFSIPPDPQATLPKTPACRDPFDVPFVELAAVAKADYLVTGDRDLLGIEKQFSRPIVAADEFLAVLAKGSRPEAVPHGRPTAVGGRTDRAPRREPMTPSPFAG